MIRLATDKSMKHYRKRRAIDWSDNLAYDEAVAIYEDNKELAKAIRKVRADELAQEIGRG